MQRGEGEGVALVIRSALTAWKGGAAVEGLELKVCVSCFTDGQEASEQDCI